MLKSLFAAPLVAVSPQFMTALATCTVNNQTVDCGKIDGAVLAFFGIWIVICLLVAVVMIVSTWKVYTKAQKPGWASIVPVYNFVVLLEITGKPIWWVILMFIPFVNLITSIIVTNELSKSFGKGIGYTVGLIVLPIIFYPMLAFGNATYTKPGVQIANTPIAPTPTV